MVIVGRILQLLAMPRVLRLSRLCNLLIKVDSPSLCVLSFHLSISCANLVNGSRRFDFSIGFFVLLCLLDSKMWAMRKHISVFISFVLDFGSARVSRWAKIDFKLLPRAIV